MDYGLYIMAMNMCDGLCIMVYGLWITVYGLWGMHMNYGV